MTRVLNNRGFTLAEVLVATTLSAFIALAAVGALKAVTDSSQVVERATETAADARRRLGPGKDMPASRRVLYAHAR